MSKNETLHHKQLKILGRLILQNMGFQSKNIREEYRLRVGEKLYIADLFAGDEHNLEKAVIIECGNSSPTKFRELRDHGIIVLHLPYTDFKDKLLISEEQEEYLREVAFGLKQHQQIANKIVEDTRKEFGDLKGEYDGIFETLGNKVHWLEELEKSVREEQDKLKNQIDTISKFTIAVEALIGMNGNHYFDRDGQWLATRARLEKIETENRRLKDALNFYQKNTNGLEPYIGFQLVTKEIIEIEEVPWPKDYVGRR